MTLATRLASPGSAKAVRSPCLIPSGRNRRGSGRLDLVIDILVGPQPRPLHLRFDRSRTVPLSKAQSCREDKAGGSERLDSCRLVRSPQGRSRTFAMPDQPRRLFPLSAVRIGAVFPGRRYTQSTRGRQSFYPVLPSPPFKLIAGLVNETSATALSESERHTAHEEFACTSNLLTPAFVLRPGAF
jgi:hypothetical protein